MGFKNSRNVISIEWNKLESDMSLNCDTSMLYHVPTEVGPKRHLFLTPCIRIAQEHVRIIAKNP